MSRAEIRTDERHRTYEQRSKFAPHRKLAQRGKFAPHRELPQHRDYEQHPSKEPKP